MLVACVLAVTACVASLQGPYVPTRDLTAEAQAVETLRSRMSGGDPSKVSKVSFFKNEAGLTSHFQWLGFGKTGVTTVTIGRPESGRYLDNKPAWADRSNLLGFDAVVARVGATQNVEDEGDFSVAGWWVAAKPYAVSVRIYPGSTKVWDSVTWKAQNEAAKGLAESAIRMLAVGGFLPLPDENAEGSLVVTAQTPSGALLSGLRVHLSIPGRREPLVATTDAQGRAKVAVPIPEADRDLKGSAVALGYTPGTKVGGLPMNIAGGLTLAIDTPFTLSQKAGFKGALALRCFVRPIYVRVEASDSSDPITRCTVTLFQDELTGRALIRVNEWERAPRDAGGRLALRMPVSRENGGRPAVVYAAARIDGKDCEGWEEITLPSNVVESAAAIVELRPIDLAKQFERFKPRLVAALQAAGFTDEEVARVRNATLRIGGKNSYKNGVITLTRDSKLRTSSETLFHEFGHLITEAIAPDEPEGVGGTHEVTDVVNLNMAWDEGRAHFYSTMLARIAGLPGAKPITDSPQGVANCENRELFVQRALLEHYGNAGLYAGPSEALANFREVHRRGAEQLGRPPRTVMEFLDVATRLPGATAAGRADLERIRRTYGFGTPN